MSRPSKWKECQSIFKYDLIMIFAHDWLSDIINIEAYKNLGYTYVDGIYVQGKLSAGQRTIWSNSEFRSRSDKQFTTSWAEQQLAEKLLERSLETVGTVEDCVIADLGCGDGRFVRSLLNRGAKKIIALNYEIEPLVSLLATLKPEDVPRVALICADVNEHPLAENISDFTIAWTLLSHTDNFQQSLLTTASITKLDGLLLSADPVLEQFLVYSLVKQDVPEFLRILKTRTRPSSWQDLEGNRYHLNSLKELRAAMDVSYFELLWEDGINTLPSLIFGGLFDGAEPHESNLQNVWNVLEKYSEDLSWFRQIVFLMRRTS